MALPNIPSFPTNPITEGAIEPLQADAQDAFQSVLDGDAFKNPFEGATNVLESNLNNLESRLDNAVFENDFGFPLGSISSLKSAIPRAITGLTIQSIVGAVVTFTAAHGVSTLGTLEPTIYTSASADHKQDAYLASAGGVLGSSDKAKDYA